MVLQSALQVLLSVCSFNATERMVFPNALQAPPFTYELIFPHPSSWRLAKRTLPTDSDTRPCIHWAYFLWECLTSATERMFLQSYWTYVLSKRLHLPTSLYFLSHRSGDLLNIIIHPTDSDTSPRIHWAYVPSECFTRTTERMFLQSYWAYVPSKCLTGASIYLRAYSSSSIELKAC